MFTKSYHIDKYLLPAFINAHAGASMIITNKYCKNIIYNRKKMEKCDHINDYYKGGRMFHYMAFKNNILCVKLSIKMGINIDIMNEVNETALILCGKYFDNNDVAQLLIDSGCNINVLAHGGNALNYACYWGRVKCVKLLLEKNIHIHALDHHDNTSLHDSCANDDHECAKLLLDGGINANIRNMYGRTALDIAIENGNTKCINLFK
jgi:ankyrin repeat protein